MEGPFLVSVMVFMVVAQAVWLAVPGRSDRVSAADRLSAYVLPNWEPRLEQDNLSVLRRKRYSRLPWLDAFLGRFNLGEGLALNLIRAGVPLRTGEFVFIQFVLGTTAAFIGMFTVTDRFGSLLASGGAAIIGFLLPLIWLHYKKLQRLDRFEAELPDAIDLMGGGLRAGYGIDHGLDLVSRGNEGPCAQEFGQVLQEVTLGSDLDTALARVNERLESEDVKLLATAVAVQRRAGGNLADVLDQIAGVIRERQQLRRDIRVLTTAPRVSGYLVALLPILTVIAMFFTSRYYVDTLFATDEGKMGVAIGSVLSLIGLYLNHRIAKVEM